MSEIAHGEQPPREAAGTDTPTLAPITSSERLDIMDILRGVALVGILLMNIEWFGRSITELGSFDESLGGVDHAAGWLVRCFVEGKFYKLFSLLFGMGFAVMLIRAQEAGRPFVAWFSRRMFVLFLFGLLHFVFLFVGDILHDYAVGGMLLLGWVLLFRTRRLSRFNHPNTFLKIAIFALFIPFIIFGSLGFWTGLSSSPAELEQRWQEEQQVATAVDERVEQAIAEGLPEEEEVEDEEAADDESDDEVDDIETKITDTVDGRLESERRKRDEIAAYTEGTYWEATVFRASVLPHMLAITPFFALTVLLPVFLVGYWFIASGTLRQHRERRHVFRWMAFVGMVFGLLASIGGLTVLQHPASEIATSVAYVGGGLFFLSQYLLCAGYIGVLVLAADTRRGKRLLMPFAPMGRMALTNYIMHSLVLALIFQAYGAGQYGHIQRASQVLIVVAIIAFQMLFSAWWLKRYRFGPLEWAWRSLTYKSWQPLRITAS